MLEVIGLLSARAPRLDRALKKIASKGGVVVLLDGPLIRTRRRTGKENRKNSSGKAHGLLFLALTDEKGNLIWISSVKPGRSSEITTARHNKLTRHLREAGLGALADLGFVGLDDDPDDNPVVITGRRPPATTSSPPPRRKRTGGLQRDDLGGDPPSRSPVPSVNPIGELRGVLGIRAFMCRSASRRRLTSLSSFRCTFAARTTRNSLIFVGVSEHWRTTLRRTCHVHLLPGPTADINHPRPRRSEQTRGP
ncbi:hypothetical protein [Streptomyces sp. NBC_00316]|uniref:hypothetical protein n=1 Tax=Streptomyces sp. NBC_00316 TaxID=2975710 RepID=UPI002E2BB29A|nr:hypothetical protein [Streptomyces sp. NBC_00316]